MTQIETTAVLRFILTSLKSQLEYTDLMYGWIVALNETLQKNNEDFARLVKQHPFYVGQPPTGQSIQLLLRNIDALIQQLG